MFAATASAAWSHDLLHVSKMSEGTRKRGHKDKEGDEEGVGEGIYIIVVEELSIELLAIGKVHL